jgi:hypothetical protein
MSPHSTINRLTELLGNDHADVQLPDKCRTNRGALGINFSLARRGPAAWSTTPEPLSWASVPHSDAGMSDRSLELKDPCFSKVWKTFRSLWCPEYLTLNLVTLESNYDQASETFGCDGWPARDSGLSAAVIWKKRLWHLLSTSGPLTVTLC